MTISDNHNFKFILETNQMSLRQEGAVGAKAGPLQLVLESEEEKEYMIQKA